MKTATLEAEADTATQGEPQDLLVHCCNPGCSEKTLPDPNHKHGNGYLCPPCYTQVISED